VHTHSWPESSRDRVPISKPGVASKHELKERIMAGINDVNRHPVIQIFGDVNVDSDKPLASLSRSDLVHSIVP
jgi:hypothetical protein